MNSVLGIDVAKLKFDAALLQDGKLQHKVFNNNKEGFIELSKFLAKEKVTQLHACLESTGIYGQALAIFLYQAGVKVSVVNPARVQAFAKSLMSRNKTDKQDAALIAQFCFSLKPEAWTPASAEVSQLQALVRRMDDLTQLHQQEVNRLESAIKSEAVAISIKKIVELLSQEIESIGNLIAQHIDNNTTLKEQKELLTSIPGIGDTTAALFLSEVLDIKAYPSVRQLDAYAGVTPKQHISGSSVKRVTPVSRLGNSKLRKAFYFPAIVAKRCNPIVKAFCERLSKKGKPKMVVIVAAIRKLLHLAYGVLKTGKAFDPNYLEIAQV